MSQPNHLQFPIFGTKTMQVTRISPTAVGSGVENDRDQLVVVAAGAKDTRRGDKVGETGPPLSLAPPADHMDTLQERITPSEIIASMGPAPRRINGSQPHKTGTRRRIHLKSSSTSSSSSVVGPTFTPTSPTGDHAPNPDPCHQKRI